MFGATDNPDQEIVFPVIEKPDVTPTILLYPFGTTSCTEIPVALEGPKLVSVKVKVTVSPIFGVFVLTDFVKARSAFSNVSKAVLEVKSLSHK